MISSGERSDVKVHGSESQYFNATVFESGAYGVGWGGEMLQCCEWMGVAMKRACGIASMIFFAASTFLEDTIIQEVFLKAEGLSPKTQAL